MTAAVRSTDDDAAQSRQSCVDLGYLDDSFSRFFVKRGTRRPPLINVGTHARTWAVDRMVDRFLDGGGEKQVLSLGAGSDTRYFRLCQTAETSKKMTKYVEVDLPESTARKARTLMRFPEFKPFLADAIVGQGGTALQSTVYHLLPIDLTENFDLENFLSPLFKSDSPTMIIAECLFIYLDPDATTRILQQLTTFFKNCYIVTYDPIDFDNPFGRMMISNLESRQIKLLSAKQHSSVAALEQRLQSAGFAHARGLTMAAVRRECLPREELQRIATLEMVDEYEEIDLVLSHYAVAWAANSDEAWTLSALSTP